MQHLSTNNTKRTTYHETTIGNIGVRTTCVTINHTIPNIIPTNAPHKT